MAKKVLVQKRATVQKKTRCGIGKNSKGHKPYRGQGGPRKRVKQHKR